MKSISKKEAAIIGVYIDEKRDAKNASEMVAKDYPLFSAACDKLAKLAGQSTFVWGPACIYRIETKKYQYSPEIEALEKTLALKKKNFEALRQPVDVKQSWAVRFNGTESETSKGV